MRKQALPEVPQAQSLAGRLGHDDYVSLITTEQCLTRARTYQTVKTDSIHLSPALTLMTLWRWLEVALVGLGATTGIGNLPVSVFFLKIRVLNICQHITVTRSSSSSALEPESKCASLS